MSIGTDANMIPVTPANTKLTIPPNANSIGVVSRILPPQIVATQPNTLIPVGTPTSIDVTINKIRIQPGVALANIWWTQTEALIPLIKTDETAITR